MRPRVLLTVLGSFVFALGLQSIRAAAATIPAGAAFNVRTLQTVAADSAWPGMRVRAVVDDAIFDVYGHVVIPRGSPATLEVVQVTRSSNMEGRDRVAFRVLSIQTHNRVYSVATNDVLFRGPSEGKKAARKILGGAGIGALAGGIFGGGTGAAIGAAAGGTTGAVMSGSGKEHLWVPAETRMQFQLNAPVHIT